MAESEFGKGIVVCLAKFSEHLQEHGPFSERTIREFAAWTPEQKDHAAAEAERFPHGDAAQLLSRMIGLELMDKGDHNAAISRAIEMWMNGASDHFYDLHPKAPRPLKELADLCLTIGHSFGVVSGRQWTVKDMDRIRELWRKSCLAVDRMLHVRPDWGEW